MQWKIASIRVQKGFSMCSRRVGFRGRSLDDGHCGIKAKQTSGEMRFSAFGVAAASFRGRWR